MLCQKCKKRQATVYYKQTINGVTRQIALCDSCAGAEGAGLDLFGSLFAGRPTAPTKRCTLCGSTYAELARRGKAGCAKCYEVFAEELAPTLAEMHGADAHYLGRGSLTGDAPAPEPTPTVDPAITALRAELAEAIENEDYERAAELRDKIRTFSQS